MKKKILSTVICAVILFAMSIVANAAYKNAGVVTYWKGEIATCNNTRKDTTHPRVLFFSDNHTSLFKPQAEIRNGYTVYSDRLVLTDGKNVSGVSAANQNGVYDPYIIYNYAQVGYETMNFGFDIY